VSIDFIAAVFNSRLLTWFYRERTQETGKVHPQVHIKHTSSLPVHRMSFITPSGTRLELVERISQLFAVFTVDGDPARIMDIAQHQLSKRPERTDVIHDLLAYLAEQMSELHKKRQPLEDGATIFRFVGKDTPCLQLDKALGGPLGSGQILGDSGAVRHDIEGLRLSQEADGHWLFEVQAKLRDPESGWREYQRDPDGSFIREWLPTFRLPLDEATGRFYHYAFANLDGFDGAGKFPGGYTRTTLEKLQATKS
jgi:hypothetical protein